MQMNIGNIINMTIMIVILITIAEIQRALLPNFAGQQLLQVAQSWQRWKNMLYILLCFTYTCICICISCVFVPVLPQAPLDHAKRNMMGSARVVIAANLLFVPFAAMMLVKIKRILILIPDFFTPP